MGNPAALSIGPGNLYISSSLSTTEPIDLAGAWPSGWLGLGYTDDGSEIGIETKMEDVEVAEELDPVAILASARTITVTMALAEITATNLKRVMNGGTFTAGGGYVYFDPPAIGTEQYCMLGWESQDVQERWIFRKAIQTGKLAIARKKAPNKATLPVEFRCVKPTGLQPYRAIMANPARA
jgi:hypothetical protein